MDNSQEVVPVIQESPARRNFVTGFGAALAVFGLGRRAEAQAPTSFTPTRHAQDDWLDEVPGKHRVMIDSASAVGAGEAILFARNLFSDGKESYDLESSDLVIVVCLRHLAARFGFGDAIWQKYGKPFSDELKFTDPRTGAAPGINVYGSAAYGDDLPTLGVTIGAVAKMGVRFAVCNGSTQRIARLTASATGGDPQAIYKELAANLIPNARLVGRGVTAVTRAQERGYALLSVG